MLSDTDCCPCELNVNSLTSRQRIVKAERVGNKLDKVFERTHVLSSLDGEIDCSHIPKGNDCDDFTKTKLSVDSEKCKKIEKIRVLKVNARSGFRQENFG